MRFKAVERRSVRQPLTCLVTLGVNWLNFSGLFGLCTAFLAITVLLAGMNSGFHAALPHPLTTLCTLLLALGVLPRNRSVAPAVSCAALLVFLTTALTWLLTALGREITLFAASGPYADTTIGSRVSLMLLAAALFFRASRTAVISQVMTMLAFSPPALALMGFVLQLPDGEEVMSPVLVLLLVPLCAAIALCTVRHGVLRFLIGPARVHTMVRRCLALAMIAPYVVGAAIVEADSTAAEMTFVILIVASSEAVGLIVAFMGLSFGNLERRRSVLQRRAEARARRDALTGALNRSTFAEQAARQLRQRRSPKSALSLLFFDVDHFKRINDRYGHHAGDVVLRRITRTTRDCLRHGDTVARWGGEEFVVLLPETDLSGAMRIADKIRQRIRAERFQDLAPELQVTVSIGCAEISASEGLDELCARADRALYQAKNSGRDRTVAA